MPFSTIGSRSNNPTNYVSLAGIASALFFCFFSLLYLGLGPYQKKKKPLSRDATSNSKNQKEIHGQFAGSLIVSIIEDHLPARKDKRKSSPPHSLLSTTLVNPLQTSLIPVTLQSHVSRKGIRCPSTPRSFTKVLVHYCTVLGRCNFAISLPCATSGQIRLKRQATKRIIPSSLPLPPTGQTPSNLSATQDNSPSRNPKPIKKEGCLNRVETNIEGGQDHEGPPPTQATVVIQTTSCSQKE